MSGRMIPHRTPFFLPLLYPSLVWRMPHDEAALYLTFDDGPMPGPTDYVLEVLRSHDARATFFCIGDNVRKHPELFRRIVDEGHTVGNHTYHHLNGWRTRSADYISNVKAFEDAVADAGIQNRVALFRPPYGRITRRQISGLRDYTIVMWDVLTRDYDRLLSKEKCFQGSVRACRPGSLVVFHDSYKAQRNMEYALPRLIEEMRQQGYSFKLLPFDGVFTSPGVS